MENIEHIGQFITNHWQLWLALIVMLLLIFINELVSQKKRGKELSPADAIELINHEEASVFDLRDAEAFRTGHVIDAIRTSADDFSLPRMEKFKTKPIILVCARGLQSATLAATLRKEGYNQPMVLAGGVTAWTAAGLPLVKGK